MAWKAEWVAVGISVLALAVAGGSTYYQQQQLAVAQQQWAATRGQLEAEAELQTFNETWTIHPRGSNIPETELLAPVQLYAILTVTNSGATQTAVKEVGIWKGAAEKFPVEADCPPTAAGEESIVTCQFPVKIPEFGTTTFYLPLTSHLKTVLQCNDYIRDNGVNAYVERVDGEITTASTEATVAVATYCQFNPPEPRP